MFLKKAVLYFSWLQIVIFFTSVFCEKKNCLKMSRKARVMLRERERIRRRRKEELLGAVGVRDEKERKEK